MRHGKKSVAQKIVYDAFDLIKKRASEPLGIFEQALKNTAPQMEVMSRRIGGATYQIPKEVRGNRKMTLAMRWIIDSAEKKKGKIMAEKLADELKLAAENQGDAVAKKMQIHRTAEANRAFAHFARPRSR